LHNHAQNRRRTGDMGERMLNIEKMSNHEWIDYRDSQLESFYRAGNVLVPRVWCSVCDVGDDYTCFECELSQLEDKG
jgi:hypothetical protein